MSAILITDGLLSEWKTRQLNLQRCLLQTPPTTLPRPNPTPEEYADFLYTLAQITSDYRLRNRDARLWDFLGSAFHTHACVEAARREIPDDDTYPILSLGHRSAFYQNRIQDIRLQVQIGGLYVLSRPPSYFARLHTLEIPADRSPMFGTASGREPIITSAPTLPSDWYGSPLYCTGVRDTSETWQKFDVFRPASFASEAEAAARMPSFQTVDFYARALHRDTGYFQARNSCYAYLPDARPATVAETEDWFRHFEVGLNYWFAGVAMADTLAAYVAVSVNTLQTARPHPVIEPSPAIRASTATDVAAPAGAISRRLTPLQIARELALGSHNRPRRSRNTGAPVLSGATARRPVDETHFEMPSPAEEPPTVFDGSQPAIAHQPIFAHGNQWNSRPVVDTSPYAFEAQSADPAGLLG